MGFYLRPGRWYQVRVAAINSYGFRGYSEPSQAFTLPNRKYEHFVKSSKKYRLRQFPIENVVAKGIFYIKYVVIFPVKKTFSIEVS